MKFCLPSRGLGAERNIPWVFDKCTSEKSGLMAIVSTNMATSVVIRKAQAVAAAAAEDSQDRGDVEDVLSEPAGKRRKTRRGSTRGAKSPGATASLSAPSVAKCLDDDSERACTWLDDVMHTLRPVRDELLQNGAEKESD